MTEAAGAGEVEVPTEIGGVQITPGGTVWSDPDGVLVGPPRPLG
jgi:regulator of ribonuclease activity A